jgi:hypothetical protein
MVDSDSFATVSGQILSALTKTTTQTQFLGTKDLPFYKSSSRKVRQSLKKSGSSLLNLCNALLEKSSFNLDPFEELDDVVDRFDGIIDVVDTLLERVVSVFCY